MKKLMIVGFVAMAMGFGCAPTYDLTKEQEQERFMESAEVQRWVEYFQNENVCNKLVWFYSMGSQAKMNPDGDNSSYANFRQQLLVKLSKRAALTEAEQEALTEMFWLGFNHHSFEDARSLHMKTRLETEGQRMNGYRNMVLKQLEDEFKKRGTKP